MDRALLTIAATAAFLGGILTAHDSRSQQQDQDELINLLPIGLICPSPPDNTLVLTNENSYGYSSRIRVVYDELDSTILAIDMDIADLGQQLFDFYSFDFRLGVPICGDVECANTEPDPDGWLTFAKEIAMKGDVLKQGVCDAPPDFRRRVFDQLRKQRQQRPPLAYVVETDQP